MIVSIMAIAMANMYHWTVDIHSSPSPVVVAKPGTSGGVAAAMTAASMTKDDLPASAPIAPSIATYHRTASAAAAEAVAGGGSIIISTFTVAPLSRSASALVGHAPLRAITRSPSVPTALTATSMDFCVPGGNLSDTCRACPQQVQSSFNAVIAVSRGTMFTTLLRRSIVSSKVRSERALRLAGSGYTSCTARYTLVPFLPHNPRGAVSTLLPFDDISIPLTSCSPASAIGFAP
mmetsp:Transcript_27175/g.67984  ORF Transcript_27175/g.67984 Transcript_27175/m.67984 type:complete len:234 (+) Transcript_27175:1757-2458(+)